MLGRFLHKIRKFHIGYSVWNIQCHIPGQGSRSSVKRKKGFTNPVVSACRLGSGCADILISHLGGNSITESIAAVFQAPFVLVRNGGRVYNAVNSFRFFRNAAHLNSRI